MKVYAQYGLQKRTPWGAGYWTLWDNAGHNPNNIVYEDWKRDTVVTKDYPLVGLYDSGEKEIHRWNIRLAKAAGIDAFWVEGLPYQGLTDWIYTHGFTSMMQAAEEENFKVAMFVWGVGYPAGTIGLIISQAIASLNTWKNSPAYLRIDGKPVYVMNRLGRYEGQGDPARWFTVADLTRFKDEVEAGVGEPIYLIWETSGVWARYGGGIPEEWWSHPKINAFFLYNDWNDGNYQFGTFTKEVWKSEYAFCLGKAHQYGKPFIYPMVPGFDNIGWGGTDYVPREGGALLQRQIDAIKETSPPLDGVMISNWNDWGEQTAFMPSITTWNDWTSPYQYLEMVTQLTSARFSIPQYPPTSVIDPVFQLKFEEIMAQYPSAPTPIPILPLAVGAVIILGGIAYYVSKHKK